MPLHPQRSLNSARLAPSRVPPDQSATDSAADARAASGSRRVSSRVMRVNRVPMVNTSTRPARRDPTAAWPKRAKPPGVGCHAPGHVEQQHQPPGPGLRRAPGSPYRDAPGAHAAPEGIAQIRMASRPAPAGAGPAGKLQLGGDPEGRDQTLGLRPLRGGEGGHVLVAQDLGRRVAHGQHVAGGGVALLGFGRLLAVVERQRQRRAPPAAPRPAPAGPASRPRRPGRRRGCPPPGAPVWPVRPSRPCSGIHTQQRQRLREQDRHARRSPTGRWRGTPARTRSRSVRIPSSLSCRARWPARTSSSMPAARTRAWSSWYLSTVPRVRSSVRSSMRVRPSAARAAAQSMDSATPGVCRGVVPAGPRRPQPPAGPVPERLRRPQPDDGDLPLEIGCSTQW